MRILVDVRHLSDPRKTGVGEYTDALLGALFALGSGDEYELLSTGTRVPDAPAASAEGAGITRTHLAIPNKLLKLTTTLARRPRLDLVAAAKPDLLWLPNLNFVSVSPDIPYVLTVHDLSWKIFPEYFSGRMRLWHRGTGPERLVAGAAAIVVPSRSTKEDVVRFLGVPGERIAVVPHGVDPSFSPTPRPQDHGVRGKHKLPRRFVLYVGTLEPRKNVVALVDALEEYRRATRDDVHLVIAGGWGWKSTPIRRRLQPAAGGTPTWIHPLGYVPRRDLPALYRAATAFAWPSVYEGFGLPVLEAMASGTPVITSHTSSLPELTDDAAILVNPFRPDEITLALEQLLSSAELQRQLRTAGLRRAERFTWAESARLTNDLFRSCVRSA